MLQRKTPSKLDGEINRLLDKLADPANADDYDDLLDRIVKLQKMKSDERLKLPSLDTVIIAGANIFGVLWLARYEKENPITAPNALRMVIRPR